MIDYNPTPAPGEIVEHLGRSWQWDEKGWKQYSPSVGSGWVVPFIHTPNIETSFQGGFSPLKAPAVVTYI